MPGARLQTWYLATGVSSRPTASSVSKVAASRIARAVAASLSTARSVRTAAIIGWSINRFWKAVRWAPCHTACASAPRICRAEPTTQSSRVCWTMRMMVATPRPSSPSR